MSINMTQLPRMFETIFKENFRYLSDIDEADRPLLAHYTSLEALEKIIKNESFLASHPFVMNDTQELIFGLTIAKQILDEFECDKKIIKMVSGKNNLEKIYTMIYLNFNNFSNKYLNSTFVLSFSEHDEKQHPDGQLSMWRGYGANGQGATLIFSSESFENNLSDFVFAKVNYGTDQNRKILLRKLYKKIFTEFDPKNSTGDSIGIGIQIYLLTLSFSLLYKHTAFKEEKEWRFIYLPSSHLPKYHEKNQTYVISKNTIQPRLNIDMQFYNRALDPDCDKIQRVKLPVHTILLGPTHNSNLSLEATKQMLTKLGKTNLINKLKASTIPYRPQSHA